MSNPTTTSKPAVDVGKGSITVSLAWEGKQWADELAKSKAALLANVKVPGFRPGKAPAETAAKYVSPAQVTDGALRRLSQTLQREAPNFDEVKKARVFGQPRMKVNALSEHKAELAIIFDLAPTVTVNKYKNFGVTVGKASVNDEEVEADIKRIVANQAMRVAKDGPVAKDDIAVIDFEGFLDDKPFPGGKADDFELQIGSNQFIPGFEDALIGLKAGDKKDVSLKFPENYHAKDLSGKPTVFKVHVKAVKTVEPTPLTDELIATLDVDNVKTVQAFRDYVRDQLIQQRQQQLNLKANDAILSALEKEIDVVVPPSLIEVEEGRLMRAIQDDLANRKTTMEAHLKATGMTNESLHERVHKDAERKVRLSLALQHVIEKEKIGVTDAELDEHLGRVGKVYHMSLEEVKRAVGDVNEVRGRLLDEKVFAFLRENAN